MKIQSSTGWARTGRSARTPAPYAKKRRARSFLRLQLAPLEMLEHHDRYHERQQYENRNGARDRPVAILEELIRQHPPDHELVRSAQQRRYDVFSDRGNKDEQRPGTNPGCGLRQSDPEKTRHR